MRVHYHQKLKEQKPNRFERALGGDLDRPFDPAEFAPVRALSDAGSAHSNGCRSFTSMTSGGSELADARRQLGELTTQFVGLQEVLKARSEELLAAQTEARREASAAELARQEKALLGKARDQLATQLDASAKSNAMLQQTMGQMSEAHSGWRKSESDGTKRMHEENETLRREWVEAKAALGRERDRAADAKREAELQLAVAQEATEAKGQEVSKGREEVARLEGQLGTMK